MPYKDFVAGATLAAAEVDSYLMRQTVMTFASAAARDSALAGVLDEGMVAYLEDTNRFTYYNGAAWIVFLGEGESFTPTWANITIGNGTTSGTYGFVGHFLSIQATLAFGSSTVVGLNPALTVPGGFVSVGPSTGAAIYADTGSTQAYVGAWVVADGGAFAFLATASGYVTSTSPFTWADTDGIFMSGLIRIA